MRQFIAFLSLTACLPLRAGPVVSFYKQFGGGGTSIQSMALDPAGNIYIVGTTVSTIPLLNPIQSTLGSSNCAVEPSHSPPVPCPDIFVAKFDPTGTNLLYATYLGPSGRNIAAGIAVDNLGNAYIAGTLDTPGSNLGTSVSPGNAFLYKLNPSGSAILYHQTINSLTEASSVAVDRQGNAYLAGASYALDFPALNALQPAPPLKPIYVSNDFGATWHLLTSGLPALTVYSLALGQNALYAATSSGLFRSVDSGVSWTNILAPAAREVVADPHSASVYVTYADSSGSIMQFAKSADGGATWTNLTSGLPAAIVGPQDFGALAMDPSNSSALWLAGISPGSPEIYKSSDAGAHWQDVHNFPTFAMPSQGTLSPDPNQSGIAVDPTNSSRIYVCCASSLGQSASAVFRTADGGSTWTEGGSGPIGGSAGIWPPVIDPHNSSTLWASWYYGLVKSTDAGQTWTAVALPASAPVQGYSSGCLALDPSGVIYLVNDKGVMLRSADSGATWTTLQGPWSAGARILAIDPAHPSTIYAGSPYNGGLPSLPEHAFVAKFDPSGNTLWATLLAGSQVDEAHAIAVDGAGNAYVAGRTNSLDFPVVNALEPVRGKAAGNGYDAFISKIAADGSKLLYSTYLGGSGDDSANAIAVDSSGNAYVAGSTNQSDFPTVNAIQATPGSPSGASFVAKIDPTGQKLIYSTYLSGGINFPFTDAAYAVAVDSAGAAWVGGFTGTVDFPLVDPVQPSTTGLSGYVAKLSPAGDSLQFSSYLNITSFDSGQLETSNEVLALVPTSAQSAWLAASGGALPSAFARLDLSPTIQPGVPSILAVYNAGGYQLGDYVSPGEIVSIFGNDLASGTEAAAAYPLPESLQGTTVTIGGMPAPLYLCCAGPDQSPGAYRPRARRDNARREPERPARRQPHRGCSRHGRRYFHLRWNRQYAGGSSRFRLLAGYGRKPGARGRVPGCFLHGTGSDHAHRSGRNRSAARAGCQPGKCRGGAELAAHLRDLHRPGTRFRGTLPDQFSGAGRRHCRHRNTVRRRQQYGLLSRSVAPFQ